jgi:hypothetical protein
MKATLLKRASLEGIPSASGLEYISGFIYIVSDDSPHLFCLDPYLNLKSKVKLYEPEKIEDGRIPKKHKRDLEAITPLRINGYPHLLILGSGSKSPERDRAWLVKLPTNYNRKHLVWEKDLSEFYNFIRSTGDIVNEGKLNIEGAATGSDFLVLYNRGNKKGKNSALYFHLEEFTEFIQGHTEGVPFPVIHTFDMTLESGLEPGFSGAVVFDDKLFYTASLEDTADAYEDGAVGHSFIGYKNVQPFTSLRGSFEIPVQSAGAICPVMDNGVEFTGKIESVVITEKTESGSYIALAVTDNDTGISELLMIEISLE